MTIRYLFVLVALGLLVFAAPTTCHGQSDTITVAEKEKIADIIFQNIAKDGVRIADTTACRATIRAQGLRAGISQCGDRYAAVYITEKELASFDRALSGNYAGVGMHLYDEDKNIVAYPIPGSPAEKSGVQDGDIIVQIDSIAVDSTITADAAADLIRGHPGTQVTVTFERNGVRIPISLTRKEIRIPSVEARMLNDSTGYVYIRTFSPGIFGEFINAIDSLQKEGMRSGLIVDLRFNLGGILDETIYVLDEFFAPHTGTIILTEQQKNSENEHRAQRKGKLADIPLVVLVNRLSASASEIFAGTIKDWGVGTVIGDTTYGKGTVQTLKRGKLFLGREFVYKFTVAEYFVGNNRVKVDSAGVIPHTIVQIRYDSIAPFAALPPHEGAPHRKSFAIVGKRIPDPINDPLIREALRIFFAKP